MTLLRLDLTKFFLFSDVKFSTFMDCLWSLYEEEVQSEENPSVKKFLLDTPIQQTELSRVMKAFKCPAKFFPVIVEGSFMDLPIKYTFRVDGNEIEVFQFEKRSDEYSNHLYKVLIINGDTFFKNHQKRWQWLKNEVIESI